MTLDLAGHVFFFIVLVGQLLVAKGVRLGWVLRAAGSAGWIFIGLVIGMSSVWSWMLVFIALDFYGWRRWRRIEEQPVP